LQPYTEEDKKWLLDNEFNAEDSYYNWCCDRSNDVYVNILWDGKKYLIDIFEGQQESSWQTHSFKHLKYIINDWFKDL